MLEEIAHCSLMQEKRFLVMGVQYSNIILHDVDQEEVVRYLTERGRKAYVSPTIGRITAVYDEALNGFEASELAELKKLDQSAETLLRQYHYGNEAVLVCLTSHLSRQFDCVALGTFVNDGHSLWYHLRENGALLDEYTTHASPDWKVGEFPNTVTGVQIKGGNAGKICRAFQVLEAVEQVEIILRKPNGNSQIPLHATNRYQALLQTENYWSPIFRHEALARALKIRPCWTVGIDYKCIVYGDVSACFEFDDDDPSLDEVFQEMKSSFIPSKD
ncbi:hypothetical protein [Leptolyngbya sp. GGD]|uniref:hypothetical protein n=1 Tax=Leptolyngbya sp. GGD TaxID=2997907 RepID=UPI00227CAB3A|nr:hypothetical protein [Leptolyngbya sp. GGD]MCY6493931.1 hypothetical protein [Leptolyngbya sp. GGD]